MTEARLIYVTGMKPKPPPAQHREALVRVLGAALKRHDASLEGWLDEAPHAFTLVSWTSLLYEGRRDISRDLPGIESLLGHPRPGRVDRREIDRLGRRLARYWHLVGDSYPLLTRVVASPALKATLGEVHRYIDDSDGLGARIRTLVRKPLLDAWAAGARVMLIGHSLGSVLAYDTLWELSRRDRHAGRVDVFMSLGSPIATRFIRAKLRGADQTGAMRFPANIERWINVSARGELVALHRRVGPFFREMQTLGLVRSIEDHEIYNHFRGDNGLDVHRSYGYLNHPVVAGAIADWLAATIDPAVAADRRYSS